MEKEALIFPNTTGLFINMYLSLDCGDGNGKDASHIKQWFNWIQLGRINDFVWVGICDDTLHVLSQRMH